MRPTDQVKRGVRWGLGHGLPGQLMRSAARRGDLQGRMTMAATRGTTEELMPLIEEIRNAGPLAKWRLGRITVDHEAVRETLSSNDVHTGFLFEADTAPGRIGKWSRRDGMHPVEPPSLLAVEPPDHTRYRRLVTRVFTARAVEKLRDRTEEIAADLLDRIPDGRPVDLVESYCAQLPVEVIAEVLGVPERDRAMVLDLGTLAAPSLDLGLPWRDFRRVEKALDAFDAWLGQHLDQLRRHPGDDLFSQLVQASDEGTQLNERELKATAGLVLVAGFETTVNLLGNGIRLLDEHPNQLRSLRAEPGLWPNAVDEILRFDPPVLLTGRQVGRDTEIVGQQVDADELIITVLAGANRDPKVFENPHRFDIRRPNARDHLSFSSGRHFCLGAALARMEGEVGLRAFYDRFGDVELLPGAHRRPTRVLRGWEHLPARLTLAADRSSMPDTVSAAS
ncbi:cytochrome P450 [Flexivirga caeni]|uniref:Cytochrome P450 n=1 Tax=Flexivirga caeni TaxID=2294115 RepID=A0A3M9MIR1_9MICO|nr:cytochrome P450 [Flexivirga caeni]RNI25470.1 cytochrome P450 [Flexivirga caeni]